MKFRFALLLLSIACSGASSTFCNLTPLAKAVADNNVDLVKKLIAEGADVNEKSALYERSTKRTPLMFAVYPAFDERAGHSYAYYADAGFSQGEPGSEKIINLLLDSGADINAEDSGGLTALMHAIVSAQKPIVQLLLERGANVSSRALTIKSKYKHTARNAAAQRKKLDEEIQQMVQQYDNAGRDARVKEIEAATGLIPALARLIETLELGERPKPAEEKKEAAAEPTQQKGSSSLALLHNSLLAQACQL